MTIVEILAGLAGMALMVHSFRHYNDMPDYDWHTMNCIHPGNRIKQENARGGAIIERNEEMG